MGKKGFYIIAWDAWGSGLVRVNPRLIDDGTLDLYGNPNNYFHFDNEEEKQVLISKLTENVNHFKVITD